jgi:hypothetical protein
MLRNDGNGFDPHGFSLSLTLIRLEDLEIILPLIKEKNHWVFEGERVATFA